jgi:hypothetical protein
VSGFWKCVLYAAALALLAHPLGQAIPGPFDPEKRLFRSRKWEKNGRVYTKLAIDKWKKLVPDMSRILPDMVKKELPGSGAVTADQAAALVQETCRAELVHGASCLLGLAFLWLGRRDRAGGVGAAGQSALYSDTTLQPPPAHAPGGAAAKASAAERRAKCAY